MFIAKLDVKFVTPPNVLNVMPLNTSYWTQGFVFVNLPTSYVIKAAYRVPKAASNAQTKLTVSDVRQLISLSMVYAFASKALSMMAKNAKPVVRDA